MNSTAMCCPSVAEPPLPQMSSFPPLWKALAIASDAARTASLLVSKNWLFTSTLSRAFSVSEKRNSSIKSLGLSSSS
jgi:hypothetical protein